MITKHNFFQSTFALFKVCKKPKRKADFVSFVKHTSFDEWTGEYEKFDTKEISSQYWYGIDSFGEYVIRESNHWVFRKTNDNSEKEQNCKMVASCNWQILLPKNSKYENKTTVIGKCYLSKFRKIA